MNLKYAGRVALYSTLVSVALVAGMAFLVVTIAAMLYGMDCFFGSTIGLHILCLLLLIGVSIAIGKTVADCKDWEAQKKDEETRPRYFKGSCIGLWAMRSEHDGDYYSQGIYTEAASVKRSWLEKSSAFNEITFDEADKLVKKWVN